MGPEINKSCWSFHLAKSKFVSKDLKEIENLIIQMQIPAFSCPCQRNRWVQLPRRWRGGSCDSFRKCVFQDSHRRANDIIGVEFSYSGCKVPRCAAWTPAEPEVGPVSHASVPGGAESRRASGRLSSPVSCAGAMWVQGGAPPPTGVPEVQATRRGKRERTPFVQEFKYYS